MSWFCGLLLGGIAGAVYLLITSPSNPKYLAADGMDKGFALLGCMMLGAFWGSVSGYFVGLALNSRAANRSR